MGNKVMRYVYLTAGIILSGIFITFLSWFFEEFIYLLQGNFYHTSIVRVLGTLIVLFFASFYLTYGIKSEKINKLSNYSLTTLISSLIISFILMIIASFGCSFGRGCSKLGHIAGNGIYLILAIGIILTVVLCLISIIKNKSE